MVTLLLVGSVAVVASFQYRAEPCAFLNTQCSSPRFSNAHAFVPQLKACLAEQLSVQQLREEFRIYVTTKVAEELVDFYLGSLDREEITGFFERQVTFQATNVFVGTPLFA